jgi:hypothetical protein
MRAPKLFVKSANMCERKTPQGIYACILIFHFIVTKQQQAASRLAQGWIVHAK